MSNEPEAGDWAWKWAQDHLMCDSECESRLDDDDPRRHTELCVEQHQEVATALRQARAGRPAPQNDAIHALGFRDGYIKGVEDAARIANENEVNYTASCIRALIQQEHR